ncbi:DNA polymerase III subunit beta [Helicobacter sp. 23-1046]
MKCSVSKTPFEIILSNFQSFLEKRDLSQITSHIYFECADNKLTLKATDYEIAITSQIEVSMEEEGKATANGKDVLNFIKNLKEGDILLEVQNDSLIIKQGASDTTLEMFNAQEFPLMPQYDENQQINIEPEKFLGSMRKINSATDTNNPKFELNGALLDVKEYAFNFVATDTRRLAIVKHESQGVNTLGVIIPKRAINEILKLFVDSIEIFFNETHIIIKSPQYIFFSKVINGKFPDYEKIIPKEFSHQIKLPKDKFVESNKIVSSLSNRIKITITKNEILFESIGDENRKTRTKIEIQTDIESFTFGAESKYLTDFLSQVESNEFTLGVKEENTPFVLSDDNFSTIIMPVIL